MNLKIIFVLMTYTEKPPSGLASPCWELCSPPAPQTPTPWLYSLAPWVCLFRGLLHKLDFIFSVPFLLSAIMSFAPTSQVMASLFLVHGFFPRPYPCSEQPCSPFSGSQPLLTLCTLPLGSPVLWQQTALLPWTFPHSLLQGTQKPSLFLWSLYPLRGELECSNPSNPSAAWRHCSAKASQLLFAILSHSLSPVVIASPVTFKTSDFFFFFLSIELLRG